MDNFMFFLETESRSIVQNGIRNFFALICKFVYKFFSGAIDLMYNLARFDFGMNDYIKDVTDRIFGLLIIFMIFKLSFSIISYVVNVDTATDSNKGFQGLIKRIVVSLILLVSINPIFATLKDAQNAIFDDDIITSIILSSDDEKIKTIGDNKLAGVRMNPHCPVNKLVYTASTGDHVALLLFRPFLQPFSKNDINDNKSWNYVFQSGDNDNSVRYCGYDISNLEGVMIDSDDKSTSESIKEQIPGPNSAEGFMKRYYINISVDEVPTGDSGNGSGGGGEYFFDFNFFFALIAGFFALLIVISFCFDVVIRSLTLILLQIIAPIPIISYISPQGKSSDMLSIWGKKVATTWVSLFIRIIALTLAISIIDRTCALLNNGDVTNVNLMMQLFLILGSLMFMKKLPQLIEELFPGLKLGGMKLNPFKRVREDALGGDMIMNAAGRTVGGLSGGIGGLAAGIKAGKEVGNVGTGALLGAFSGIGTGFSKKKMAFGDGMNNAYKNLTGNEMNRLTMTGLMLSNSKKGQNKMNEIKGTLDTAYDKMNTLRTRLNVSEHSSAQLASSLSSRGYDVTSFDGMRTDANNRIGLANARLQGLENNRLNLDNDQQNAINAYNTASANYSDAENTYNGTQGVYQNAETMYNNAVANHRRVKTERDNIERQISDIQKQLSESTAIGSFNNKLYDDMSRLEKQKANLERYMTAAEGTISARERDLNNARISVEDARTNMDSLREIMVNAETNMNTAVENYNNVVNEINQVNNEIASYNNDLESIDRYENQGRFENEIRSDISKLDKAISVISAEKSQVENFYRQDKAPTADYKDKVDVVNNLDVNRSVNDI